MNVTSRSSSSVLNSTNVSRKEFVQDIRDEHVEKHLQRQRHLHFNSSLFPLELW